MELRIRRLRLDCLGHAARGPISRGGSCARTRFRDGPRRDALRVGHRLLKKGAGVRSRARRGSVASAGTCPGRLERHCVIGYADPGQTLAAAACFSPSGARTRVLCSMQLQATDHHRWLPGFVRHGPAGRWTFGGSV